MEQKLVRASGISKSFGNVNALNDVSFSVEKGELFGFIGPDGAGKTTMFRIMTTLLLPDKGTCSVLGFNVNKDYRKIREKVGYMPGRFSLYYDLTVEENLTFYASIFGTTIKENYYLIEDIYSHIEPFKNRFAGKLSGGMKQKLALSCALIHKPEILFLDEPTTGVDAVSRKEFWEMLRKLKNMGISIIVSTPYMDEAELCDKVALIQKGTILRIDTPEAVIDSYDKKLFSITTFPGENLTELFKRNPHCHSVFRFGDELHFTTENKSMTTEELRNYITQNNLPDRKVNNIKPGIEDCFMSLMS